MSSQQPCRPAETWRDHDPLAEASSAVAPASDPPPTALKFPAAGLFFVWFIDQDERAVRRHRSQPRLAWMRFGGVPDLS